MQCVSCFDKNRVDVTIISLCTGFYTLHKKLNFVNLEIHIMFSYHIRNNKLEKISSLCTNFLICSEQKLYYISATNRMLTFTNLTTECVITWF